jgi:hypothetical protein
LIGLYKRASRIQLPKPRIQIRKPRIQFQANFEEMRASRIWLQEAGTALHGSGLRLPDTGQGKK